MEDDILCDSIDDIISVLNTNKGKDKATASSIQHLLDQCIKNDVFEVESLLNTVNKKPTVSTRPRGLSNGPLTNLTEKKNNLYVNPIKINTINYKSRPSISSAKSSQSENFKLSMTSQKSDKTEERNLTYHEKATGTNSLIRYLRFLPLSQIDKRPKTPPDNGYYYRMSSDIKVIKYLLEENGFLETHGGYDYTLYWITGPIKHEVYQTLNYYQKVNHFPKSHEITRKDNMHRNISRMQLQYGLKNFNFIPKSFILPNELPVLIQDFEKNKGLWYIVKPQASSQGRGIFITDQLDEILPKQNSQVVVSHYIHDPYLINDLKFDLRVYVAVTSIYPLRIYMYEEGLVRFATDPYTKDPSSQANRYAHLTNYSINKFSENYVQNENDDDQESSHKWSFTAFRQYLESQKIDHKALFAKIEDVVVRTILSVENTVFSATTNQVSFRNNCFELFGFDILLDSKLKPWLLEVNLSPSLACEASLDLKIKGEMLADLFTMIGVVPLDQRTNLSEQQLGKAFNLYTRELNIPNFDKKVHKEDLKPVIDLTKEEKQVIKETNEEYEKKGKFKRIFPAANINDYTKFFENDRPYNKLLRNLVNDNLRKKAEPKFDTFKVLRTRNSFLQ